MQHAASDFVTHDMTVPHAQYQQARCNTKQTVVVANNPSGHHTSMLRRAPLLDEERLSEQLRPQRDDPVVGPTRRRSTAGRRSRGDDDARWAQHAVDLRRGADRVVG